MKPIFALIIQCLNCTGTPPVPNSVDYYLSVEGCQKALAEKLAVTSKGKLDYLTTCKQSRIDPATLPKRPQP